jgi:hypothetical protein
MKYKILSGLLNFFVAMMVVVLIFMLAMLFMDITIDKENDLTVKDYTDNCQLVAMGESFTGGSIVDFRATVCQLPDGTICVFSSSGGVDCDWDK